MATMIAEYFTDELTEWGRLISLYRQEIVKFEIKLAEVIQRNNIPGIAVKVEKEQDKLNTLSRKFYWLQERIQQQLAALKKDSSFVDDTLIKAETEKRQNELRHSMQHTEKRYIDVKYQCYQFLSDTLKK